MAIDVFLAFSRDIPGITLPAQSELTDRYIAQNTPTPGHYFVETKEHQLGIQGGATAGSASGADPGKARLSEVVVTKQVDQLTPYLLQLCGLGVPIADVRLYSRKAGGNAKTQKPHLVHTLRRVLIKAVTWSCNADDAVPEEHLTLAYGALKMELWKQKKDGSLTGAPITGVWNQGSNSPSFEG